MCDLLALAGKVYNKPSFLKVKCVITITKLNSKQSLIGHNQLTIWYGIQSLVTDTVDQRLRAWKITVVQSPMRSTHPSHSLEDDRLLAIFIQQRKVMVTCRGIKRGL